MTRQFLDFDGFGILLTAGFQCDRKAGAASVYIQRSTATNDNQRKL